MELRINRVRIKLSRPVLITYSLNTEDHGQDNNTHETIAISFILIGTFKVTTYNQCKSNGIKMSHFYFKYVCGLLALLTFLELCTADGKKKGSGTFGPYYQWAASYLPKKQYGHGHGQGGYGHGGHGHGGSGKRTLCFKKGLIGGHLVWQANIFPLNHQVKGTLN